MKGFGLIVVNKPIGPTSHKVVNIVRRGTGVRKVGHAGTLDPRASGVLVLCLGSATRLSEYLSSTTKRYEAVIRFGKSTQTYDAEGAAIQITGAAPSEDDLRAVLPEFTGKIMQKPPPYSAIKVQGRKAYELAREGKPVDLYPREVEILKLEMLSYNPPDLAVVIECSAGTYIRSIAHDLGARLTTGAFLASLRRTRSGPFTIEESVPLHQLEHSFMGGDWREYLRPAADALPDLPIVRVSGKTFDDIKNGRRIPITGELSAMARAIGPDGDLVAVLEAVEDGTRWHPRKVFGR